MNNSWWLCYKNEFRSIQQEESRRQYRNNLWYRYERSRCRKYQEQEGGIIEKNGNDYKVDGEVGRFTFKTYSIYLDGKNIMNTSKDVFKTLYSKEWYGTVGFNELALDFSSHMSLGNQHKNLIE